MQFKTVFVILFINTFLIFYLQAQVQRCYTDEYIEARITENPEYEKLLNEADKIISHNLASADSRSSEIYTIPVVVHVLYNNSEQNISNHQILSQIEVLNEDFRRNNADASNTPVDFQSVAADAHIQFCLASTDPDGNPTIGITRTQTSTFSFPINDNQIKRSNNGGKDGWPPEHYLNIWVCNLTGALGYAEMPVNNPNWRDGVVIGYKYFGRDDAGAGVIDNKYSEGRTTTHEVGHWLGLHHIWGDAINCTDDDGIADTPMQFEMYYGCPTHPQESCGSHDMFMNYMDYTDDHCMNIFTLGQRTWMRTVLTTLRSSILNSPGCDFNVDFDVDVGIDEINSPVQNTDYCASKIRPVFTFTNYGSITVNSLIVEYQVNNEPVKTFNWNGNLNTFHSTQVSLPMLTFTSGIYNLTITLKDPNGFTDENPANNSMSVSFSVSPEGNAVGLPFVENFEQALFPPSGWSFSHPNADFQWERTDSVGGFGQSEACALFDSFSGEVGNNPMGRAKSMITQALTFDGNANPHLDFDVAYARFNQVNSEGLDVAYSLDCGNTWKTLYFKEGTELATRNDYGYPFFPQPNEWRTESISLYHLRGVDNVKFRFTVHSEWGNNLFLDNINIREVPTSVKKIEADQAKIKLYPNPASDFVTIELLHSKADETVNLTIFDLMGRDVYKAQYQSGILSGKQIDVSRLTNGFYYFLFEIDGKPVTKKFIKH